MDYALLLGNEPSPSQSLSRICGKWETGTPNLRRHLQIVVVYAAVLHLPGMTVPDSSRVGGACVAITRKAHGTYGCTPLLTYIS